jgi:hypothetical protein
VLAKSGCPLFTLDCDRVRVALAPELLLFLLQAAAKIKTEKNNRPTRALFIMISF